MVTMAKFIKKIFFSFCMAQTLRDFLLQRKKEYLTPENAKTIVECVNDYLSQTNQNYSLSSDASFIYIRRESHSQDLRKISPSEIQLVQIKNLHEVARVHIGRKEESPVCTRSIVNENRGPIEQIVTQHYDETGKQIVAKGFSTGTVSKPAHYKVGNLLSMLGQYVKLDHKVNF